MGAFKFFRWGCIIICSHILSVFSGWLTMREWLLLGYNSYWLINLSFRNITEIFFSLHNLNYFALSFVFESWLDHSLPLLKMILIFLLRERLNNSFSLLVRFYGFLFFIWGCLDNCVSHLGLELSVLRVFRWGCRKSIHLVSSLLLPLGHTRTCSSFGLSWSLKCICAFKSTKLLNWLFWLWNYFVKILR